MNSHGPMRVRVGTGIATVQKWMKLEAVSSMNTEDFKFFDRLPRRDRR
jgi:hypothetical protein